MLASGIILFLLNLPPASLAKLSALGLVAKLLLLSLLKLRLQMTTTTWIYSVMRQRRIRRLQRRGKLQRSQLRRKKVESPLFSWMLNHGMMRLI
ncbi:hypothetical protein Gotri_009560 [Gossypium trilobum]|uniref:Uncharacterized protein n=1 Tax=Gossypium trilobum TaxID=34281 RepID=A0A7J9EMU0_9ROSI|nr:hypothetical protein [Gossypium trilobum]